MTVKNAHKPSKEEQLEIATNQAQNQADGLMLQLNPILFHQPVDTVMTCALNMLLSGLTSVPDKQRKQFLDQLPKMLADGLNNVEAMEHGESND